MKILGIGVDLVENKRIKLLLSNKKFLKRIFTKNEIKFSKKIKNKVNYFAKRYAAKEAFSKSVGTGIRLDLDFKKIEILNDKMNKPYYSNSKLVKNIIYKRCMLIFSKPSFMFDEFTKRFIWSVMFNNLSPSVRINNFFLSCFIIS